MHVNNIHSIYCFACFRNALVSFDDHKYARATGTDEPEPDTTSMPSSPTNTDNHALDAMTQTDEGIL